MHNPDVLLHVDVRHDRSYIYEGKIPGFGGLPLGTNGKGLTLLSGGIDSPVATWMMAKRGHADRGGAFSFLSVYEAAARRKRSRSRTYRINLLRQI